VIITDKRIGVSQLLGAMGTCPGGPQAPKSTPMVVPIIHTPNLNDTHP